MPNSTDNDVPAAALQPPRTRPRDRRAQILRISAEVFSENGFHSASMARIAQRVGISAAALYRHFSSKQDLLSETLRAGLETTLHRLENADDTLAALVDVALEYRGLPRLWRLEIRHLADDSRALMLAQVRRLVLLIETAIAVRRPDLDKADTTFLAWTVIAIASSPSHHNVQLPRERYRRLLANLVDAALSAEFVSGTAHFDVSVSVLDSAFDDLQQERLIVAAARLFNTRGYAAVGIEDIGTAVGITGSAIYHHFASKADLLNEIISRNEQWIGHYISRACAQGKSAEDSLSLLINYTVAFASRSPDIVGTALSEARHLPEEQSRRYRRVHRAGVMRWAHLLQAAHPQTPEDEARVQVQAVTTVVIDAVQNPRLTSRPAFGRIVAEIGRRMSLATP